MLVLVFKDAILGLAAGVQLSANRMVARGDWIEMPKFNADGTVLYGAQSHLNASGRDYNGNLKWTASGGTGGDVDRGRWSLVVRRSDCPAERRKQYKRGFN